MQSTNIAGRKGFKGRHFKYEVAFMRMVVREYEQGTASQNQVAQRFNVTRAQIKHWRSLFSSDLEPSTILTAPMTEQEQKELEALKRQNAELTKKLEYANLQVFGLQTLIDVAEEQLKIEIRKKPGTKPSKK